jgi:hypothetical protein
MTTVVTNDLQNPPKVARHTRKDVDTLRAIPNGVPRTGHSAAIATRHEDVGAQPKLPLHIAYQTGGQIPAGLPTLYLCGAPVRLLLGEIPAGDGPDGPGVCPICAAFYHLGRLPAQTGDTNIA